MRLYLRQHQSPGDILMLTAAVRDLKAAFPDIRVNVETTAQDLWANNPLLDPGVTPSNADRQIELEYPLVHHSSALPYHFVHAFRKELQIQLGLRIPQGAFRGDVYLSDAEKEIPAAVRDLGRYWLIDAGYKQDFPLKHWGTDHFRALVSLLPGIPLVQIGQRSPGHVHPVLPGVTDLTGRTSIRDLIRLMYHAAGVITPVSFPMHLAAAVPTPDGRLRPAVVLAGGREAAHWEAYPGHVHLSTVGALDCCRRGGCWRSTPDGRNACAHPISLGSDRIGQCMTLIPPEHVAHWVRVYHSVPVVK